MDDSSSPPFIHSSTLPLALPPAEILITTPESLYLLLTSSAREALRSVRTVIVDEVHALVATKRGAHPALSLERLEHLARPEAGLQRIGLSPTVHPVDEAARFLGGMEDGSNGRMDPIHSSTPPLLHSPRLRPRPARVGELDEEMVFESRVGETFLLGASTWRIEQITHDRVLVSPAPGEPGKMPFWRGPRAGRPLEFGRAIGALCRRLRALPEGKATRLLVEKHSLSEGAARNLLQYLRDQSEAAGAVPDDRTIVVERYLDEIGDWRVCVLSPFGSQVHAPWARAIASMVGQALQPAPGGEPRSPGSQASRLPEAWGGTTPAIDVLWTDDGIVARFPEADEPPPAEALLPDPDEVEDLVIRQLGAGGGRGGALGTACRHWERGRPVRMSDSCAGASAPGPGSCDRLPHGSRGRAADLLRATARYGDFPIVLEAYRECLRDDFDMPAPVELLRAIGRREIRVVTVNSRTPSPFAASLMFNYVASFIYDGDAPLAERRAQGLLVDPAQLRQLLGEIELRELLDPGALEQVELQLQHLEEERKARHPDAIHDLLLRLGDLSRDELLARLAIGQAHPDC